MNDTIAPVDESLRHDVSHLASLLGDVLKAHGEKDLFDLVENARVAARARREGQDNQEDVLCELLDGLHPDKASELVLAFSSFFSVVNMAERVHKLRRLRVAQASSGAPAGSLAASVQELKDHGLEGKDIISLLEKHAIMPVFTAHPTEVSRRTHLIQEQRIARLLVDRIEQGGMTPDELLSNVEQVREQITLMWQTAEQAPVGRSVADERQHVLFYLMRVIYRVVPVFYEKLSRTLAHLYDEEVPLPRRALIQFGSWVGGDMDGNPLVGADTLAETLSEQRKMILTAYDQDIIALARLLSQSQTRVGFTPRVFTRIMDYERLLPEVAAKIPARHRDMPYRVLLTLIRARVRATLEDRDEGYAGAEALVDDLCCIVDSLKKNDGTHAGLHSVMRLMWRVRTFGFHLATVDLRQDALDHRRAISFLLDEPQFETKPAQQRTDILAEALATGVEPSPVLPEPTDGPGAKEARRALEVMHAVSEGRRLYGDAAVGPFIISMAQGPDDALAVLYLAKRAGLTDDDGSVPLDIAPLFETVDDLASARQTMQTLFDDPMYREHLQRRGMRQMVMLGYSDSSKGDGLATSRWALYRAQSQLVDGFRDAGVALQIFHGRGGTVSRGGSHPRQAVLAEPKGAVSGSLRVTEQGEIIHVKYGLRGTALRTLELMSGAVLERSARTDDVGPPREARELMDRMSEASSRAFRGLVYEHPDFMTYFRGATPIDVIERLRIGSRPASRRSGGGVENLRAIPWVFSWVQSRHLLPGWYGVGAGLEAISGEGVEALREMAETWPFFGNLLSDVEMVLAKADMGIAARYAKLAGDAGDRIFPLIREEYERTRAWICRIKDQQELLESEPQLQRGIRLRDPYVDPMSLLQVDLLRRWRAGDRKSPALERALITTVRGIARGMQNSG